MKQIFAVLFFLVATAGLYAALQKAPEPEGPIPDLKPPLEAVPLLSEQRSWRWAWVAGGALAAGLITTFILGTQRKPLQIVPPYVIARKALDDACEGSNPTLVWAIFRNYVHERFGLKRGSTAEELIKGLAVITTIREKTKVEMARLFEECDIARFTLGKTTVPDLVERAKALLNALESQQVGTEPRAIA